MGLFDTNQQTQTTAITQNASQTGATSNNQTGVTQGTFTPQQQALQSQVLGNYSNYLSGGSTPAQWQAPPQQAVDWATNQFNREAAPSIATQFGPNSPQLANRQQELIANLYATGWQQGSQNYMQALNGAANFAFNPTGQTSNLNNAGTSQATSNGTENRNVVATTNPGGLLNTIGSLLAGGFQF